MEQQPFSQQPFSQPPVPRPKNWLVESILVTLFCCLPLGIVGIVNSANINSRYDAGDYAGAQNASEQAGKWTKIGFFVGLAVIAIYIVLMIVGIGGSLMGGYR